MACFSLGVGGSRPQPFVASTARLNTALVSGSLAFSPADNGVNKIERADAAMEQTGDICTWPTQSCEVEP